MMTDATKRDIIRELIDHVTSEVEAIDEEERYDQMLDDVYGDDLPGVLAGLSVSQIMKEMQPTDYRIGKNDFFSSDDQLYDIGGSYYDRDDVEAARESFVSDLEDKLSDAEAEAAEGMQMDGCDVDDDDTVIELREAIAFVNAYTF